MSSIYARLGVPVVINAVGPATRLSGSLMPLQVSEAMKEASQFCVDMAELQGRASQIIADITGAEAGYVTSGASAALLLGTAACVTGLDPSRMTRLPNTQGMKNEIIMVRSQRNSYDHAVRSVGIQLVEVGLPDRFAGAGMRDAEAWEIGDAITDRTAAVYYVVQSGSLPSLPEVVEVCHTQKIPVLVDAAGQLPPVSNLKAFINQGADLVVFSGGKAIRGPQSSGILCGRKDLISAAALQQLDLDIIPPLWNPPVHLIDTRQLPGIPRNGIGRPCKVGKEEIVGLLTALRLFVEQDPEKQHLEWLKLLRMVQNAAGEIRQGKLLLVETLGNSLPPRLDLELEADGLLDRSECAIAFIKCLQEGEPSIQSNPSRIQEGIISFSPLCLKPEDTKIIGHRIKSLLG